MGPEFGDRKTNFVFIEVDLEGGTIIRELDQCLLTAEEMEEDWTEMEDPYTCEI